MSDLKSMLDAIQGGELDVVAERLRCMPRHDVLEAINTCKYLLAEEDYARVLYMASTWLVDADPVPHATVASPSALLEELTTMRYDQRLTLLVGDVVVARAAEFERRHTHDLHLARAHAVHDLRETYLEATLMPFLRARAREEPKAAQALDRAESTLRSLRDYLAHSTPPSSGTSLAILSYKVLPEGDRKLHHSAYLYAQSTAYVVRSCAIIDAIDAIGSGEASDTDDVKYSEAYKEAHARHATHVWLRVISRIKV